MSTEALQQAPDLDEEVWRGLVRLRFGSATDRTRIPRGQRIRVARGTYPPHPTPTPTPHVQWKVVKKTYFKAVLKAHPDKGGDPAVFRKIQSAFEGRAALPLGPALGLKPRHHTHAHANESVYPSNHPPADPSPTHAHIHSQ